ncbi:hypothetical protein BH09BAC1_BH09BAC1_08400 [soil metagenome]
MKEQLTAQFIEFRDDVIALLPKLLVAIIVLLIFWGLGRLVNLLFTRRFQRRWNDSIVVSFLGTTIKGLLYLIGLAIAMYVLGFGGMAGSLVAGAGVTAIVVGFAFKDIAENFLAGFLLAINRPFKIHDIIEIEGFKGTVSQMNIRTTLMRMPDGRDVFVPNAFFIKNILTNYTRDGLIRQEFMIGLDTATDVKKARGFILAFLETEEDVLKDPKPNVIVEQLGNFTIDVKVLFWISTFKIAEEPELHKTADTIRSRMIREIKDIMLREGFNLPNFVVDHRMYSAQEPLHVKLGEDNSLKPQ